MKEAGTTDAVLLGYLKAHAAELPGLIDFQTVSRLQEAGAGRTVIAYLTTVSAVEIGPTGAVGGPHEEPMEASVPAEAMMSNELPIWYGGYGGVVEISSGTASGTVTASDIAEHFLRPTEPTSQRPRVNAPMNAPMVRPQPRFSRR